MTECPVATCYNLKPGTYLVCRECWRKVPQTTKKRLRQAMDVSCSENDDLLIEFLKACMVGIEPQLIVLQESESGPVVVMGGSW